MYTNIFLHIELEPKIEMKKKIKCNPTDQILKQYLILNQQIERERFLKKS